MRWYEWCEQCHERFELTADDIRIIGLPNRRRYCARRCARAAWLERTPTARRCKACGRPAPTSAYGLVLCPACRALAYRTCWRKIRYATRNEAPSVITGEPMFVLRCSLCPGWHNSRNFEGVSPGYERARSLLGLYLRRINFDVIKVRGWANEPKQAEGARA